MAQTRKLLVAFDPKDPQSHSSDYLVPVKRDGHACFCELKSGAFKQYGVVIFLGRSITENDLFAKLVESGAKIDSVSDTLALLGKYIETLQEFRIGNVVRIIERNAADISLNLVSATPASALKALQRPE
jgi:hypothetical protein